MKQQNFAKSVILKIGKVREGKIKIFPQSIINDLEEFNNKFEIEFAYDISSDEVMETLRKIYNNYAHSDYSKLKHKTKQWFNKRFYPYACVVGVK